MKNCIVCGIPTRHPIKDALFHFKLYQPNQFQFWRGNMRAFGFWSGLWSNIGLSFPIIGLLANWKYRKYQLSFSDDAFENAAIKRDLSTPPRGE